jgi:hypothetical protein
MNSGGVSEARGATPLKCSGDFEGLPACTWDARFRGVDAEQNPEWVLWKRRCFCARVGRTFRFIVAVTKIPVLSRARGMLAARSSHSEERRCFRAPVGRLPIFVWHMTKRNEASARPWDTLGGGHMTNPSMTVLSRARGTPLAGGAEQLFSTGASACPWDAHIPI